MKTATFTKNGSTIRVTALNSAGMGFISSLVMNGWYSEEESYDLCFEYQETYVSIEEIAQPVR
jgi:hypothetical protein